MRSLSPLNSQRIAPVVVFTIVVVMLMAASWHNVLSVNFETGDAAANSLLVQDAKSLKLLTGNYSRLGFNHPGPAILYVLALGERVFYDWLNVVPYPLGGQLLGAVFYSAFWITLMWTMLKRMLESALSATLLLAVFLASSAFVSSDLFCGLWFPHLYYFPFATFTLASSRLVIGRSNFLPTLAISWGFLINGHVSFVAITAIMLICAILANMVFCKRATNKSPFVLSWDYLRAGKANILVSLLIVTTFLLPLAMGTMVHFPGPIADYFLYSQGNHWHNILTSFHFAAAYWGGMIWFIAGGLALAIVCICEKEKAHFPDIFSLVVSMLGATAGLLFYATVGVDDLHFMYVGLFYYAVPAITIAVIVYVIHTRCFSGCNNSVARILPAIAILVCLGFVFQKIRYSPAMDCESRIPELFAKMRTLGSLPLVLDLDNSSGQGNDWTHVWATIVGVESYAKRRGVPLLLIRKNWHILFTKNFKYPSDQVPVGDCFLVSTSNLPSPALGFLGLSFYPVKHFPIKAGMSFAIATNRLEFQENFLGPGWFAPENDLIWSEGKEAELALEFESNARKRLYLDMKAFLPTAKSVQHIDVTANNVALGGVTFTQSSNRGKYYFDLPENIGKSINLQVRIEKPISPREAGISADKRKLGVALFGIGVE